MTKNAQGVEDTSYVDGLTSYKKPKKIEQLPSRPKGDLDEEVVGRIHNLPEGYGAKKSSEINPRATSSFRAKISSETWKEMNKFKKENVGLTYAAMIQEMWELYKKKHKIRG